MVLLLVGGDGRRFKDVHRVDLGVEIFGIDTGPFLLVIVVVVNADTIVVIIVRLHVGVVTLDH